MYRSRPFWTEPCGRPDFPKPAGRPDVPKPAGRPDFPKPVGRPDVPKPAGRPDFPKPAGRPDYPKPAGRPNYPKPAGRPNWLAGWNQNSERDKGAMNIWGKYKHHSQGMTGRLGKGYNSTHGLSFHHIYSLRSAGKRIQIKSGTSVASIALITPMFETTTRDGSVFFAEKLTSAKPKSSVFCEAHFSVYNF